MKTRIIPPFKVSAVLLIVFCFALGISRAPAAQLIWDPGLTVGVTPGGTGNWDTTAANTNWFNGTIDTDWTQTSTTAALNGATFGGSGGTVTLDVGQIAVNSLIVNSSGYTFAGSAIDLNTLDTLSLANNVSATFNCNITGPNSFTYFGLGTGATMNIGGVLSGSEFHFVGPVGSAFNLTGGVSSFSQWYVLGPVNLSAGSVATTSTSAIGYPDYGAGFLGTQTVNGSLTVSGSAVFSPNGNIFMVGREFNGVGGQGTLTINGGTVNVGATAANRNLAICYDGGGPQPDTTLNERGTVNVTGGILNVGTSTLVSSINFFETACFSGELSTMSISGGTVNTWGGIIFGGNTAGNYSGGIATLTQTGGILNIGGGVNGIIQGTAFTSPNSFTTTLSGGTNGALANWSSSLPIALGTVNGNITFQCGNGSAPFNISLSGALTGSGGLNVTGGGGANTGTLTLSGANNYGGSTLVSSGTLAISTGPSPVSGGSVTLDGTTGPTAVTVNTTSGDSWSIGSGLAFQNGTTTLSFQFGALPPSPSVAPIQVTGGVAFMATPSVLVGGTEIANGTYPLIKYTGSVSGTMPTVPTLSGSATAATLVNNAGTKTISLVVTSSSVTAPVFWAGGNGNWDILTTPNWKQSSAPADYNDGDAVVFDDSATGTGPFTVTLNNTTVNPLSVTFNNAAKSYIITNVGTGTITGSSALSALGTGTNTLTGVNTYSGGTVLSAGQLNINNGGTVSGTAIGTGTLTINGGTIDNTSGSDVTLQASIPETWNGSFNYLGSANNFNTGAGNVTMNNSLTISNGANNFTVGGNISDSGTGYLLTKSGSGALTLAVANNFGGGLTVQSGQLNLGNANAAGTGALTIFSGALDNTSGSALVLAGIPGYNWNGNFTYLGSANDLDLGSGAPVTVLNGLGTMTLTVANHTLSTDYNIISGNTRVIKAGPGTWNITGAATSANNLGLTVNAGQVNLARIIGESIGASIYGMTVNNTGTAIDMNSSFQVHNTMPVTLSSGTWDLNGFSENIAELTMNNGNLQDSDVSGGTSTLTISGNASTLSNPCTFNVVAANATMEIAGVLGGNGDLVANEGAVNGLGTLDLVSNNTYTGMTLIVSGTLALTGIGSINNSSEIVVDEGGTFDVSGVDPYTLSTSTTLLADGSGTIQGATAATINDSASGGVVSLGSQGITLKFFPLSVNGDTSHPSLYISQGALTLNGNTFTVDNEGPGPLNAGTFTLIQVAGGTINSSGSYSVSVTGNGLVGGMSASIQVTGGSVNMVVSSAPVPASFVGPFTVSGSTLTLAGSGGTHGGTYHVYTSPNAAAPLTSWTLVGSGSFSNTGQFSFPTTINPNTPAQFYILKEP